MYFLNFSLAIYFLFSILFSPYFKKTIFGPWNSVIGNARYMWNCVIGNAKYMWNCEIGNAKYMWNCVICNAKYMWNCVIGNAKYTWNCVIGNAKYMWNCVIGNSKYMWNVRINWNYTIGKVIKNGNSWVYIQTRNKLNLNNLDHYLLKPCSMSRVLNLQNLK